MRRPGANHLDRQRLLLPRDYATDPYRYGRDPDIGFLVPPGGDVISAIVARTEHDLIVAWRRCDGPSGAELSRRYGFSKQTWSRTILGQRWAGELVLVALLRATRR